MFITYAFYLYLCYDHIILGRPTHRWEENMTIVLQEVGKEG